MQFIAELFELSLQKNIILFWVLAVWLPFAPWPTLGLFGIVVFVFVVFSDVFYYDGLTGVHYRWWVVIVLTVIIVIIVIIFIIVIIVIIALVVIIVIAVIVRRSFGVGNFLVVLRSFNFSGCVVVCVLIEGVQFVIYDWFIDVRGHDVFVFLGHVIDCAIVVLELGVFIMDGHTRPPFV
jgi:hypothetical protein